MLASMTNTGVAQGGCRGGTGVAKGWHRGGTGVAQEWHKGGTGVAQGRHRGGTGVAQCCRQKFADGRLKCHACQQTWLEMSDALC